MIKKKFSFNKQHWGNLQSYSNRCKTAFQPCLLQTGDLINSSDANCCFEAKI